MIRRLFFWGLLIAAVLFWAFGHRLAPTETITVKTARVKDGDTIILNRKAYRLTGVDAPEYHQLCKDAAGKDWPCGKIARMQLATYVASGSIVCEAGAEDRFGRRLAKCASATVPDLGEAMVTAGFALSPETYAKSQASARAEKRGIWQGTFATPAEWRAAHPRKDDS